MSRRVKKLAEKLEDLQRNQENEFLVKKYRHIIDSRPDLFIFVPVDYPHDRTKPYSKIIEEEKAKSNPNLQLIKDFKRIIELEILSQQAWEKTLVELKRQEEEYKALMKRKGIDKELFGSDDLKDWGDNLEEYENEKRAQDEFLRQQGFNPDRFYNDQ